MADERTYEVPDEAAARAHVDRAGYEEMYARSLRDPEGFWSRTGGSVRHLVAQVGHGQRRRLSPRPHPVVRGRQAQRRPQLPRSPPPLARRPGRRHLGGRRPRRGAPHHLRRTARGGLPLRQRAQGSRSREGRPGVHLHADDPGSGGRDARVRPDRGHPLRGLRRVLRRVPPRPHQRLLLQGPHHGRRGHSRGRKRIPLKANGDTACEGTPSIEHVVVVRRSGGDVSWQGGPGPLVPRARGGGLEGLPPGGHGRRGPACSSCTRPGPPESRRACCTPPAATSCTPR